MLDSTIKMIDCHMHTPLCGHAEGEPEAYVKQAARLGIDLITFTCHIPMKEEKFAQKGIRMKAEELPTYWAMIERARELGESLGVRVLGGIESEIYPDTKIMERMDKTLALFPFDFVLGSLHSHLTIYKEYLQAQGCVTDDAIVERYFTDLTEGVKSRRYDSIAHPDVVRMYGLIKNFKPTKYESAIRHFLQTAVEHDQCLEINTSGLTKGDFVLHPDPVILDWAVETGNCFTLGSDSHKPESVGQKFPEVLEMIKAKGINKLHYFVARKRCQINLT